MCSSDLGECERCDECPLNTLHCGEVPVKGEVIYTVIRVIDDYFKDKEEKEKDKIDIFDYKQKVKDFCEEYQEENLCNLCPLKNYKCGNILDKDFKEEWLHEVTIILDEPNYTLKNERCPHCGFDYSTSNDIINLNYCPKCGKKVEKYRDRKSVV